MKAFLSHSSRDKGFVDAVAALLRPGSFELDSETFDAGLLNSQAIIQALRRSDVFCLFVSESSVESPYVDFETLLGTEFLAQGQIKRFLIICLDDISFGKTSDTVRLFNVLRKAITPESAARLLQGSMIAAVQNYGIEAHPFIGRETELLELEGQVTDIEKPTTKAIFVSGNFGSGRRTLARKFYEDQYPRTGRVFPLINVDDFTGIEELYRNILTTLRPSLSTSGLVSQVRGFQLAKPVEQRRLAAQLLNSLLEADEAAFLYDRGGLLTDAGGLQPEINDVISHLQTGPHPAAIIIAPRMIPLRVRRTEDDVSYVAVHALKRDATKRLISRLIKDIGIKLESGNIDELVKLSDGHPFNIYRIMDEIREKSISVFLANPTEFIEWKHRYSSEYVGKIQLTEADVAVLSLLKMVPELDFQAIVSALEEDAAVLGEAVSRLSALHVIDAGDSIVVSPPLRIAVERDPRIRLSAGREANAMRSLARSLSIRFEEGTAPVALVDAAVLSALDSGEALPVFASALLLPSHFVWLAKRHYDLRDWEGSIRNAREALKGQGRLSVSGLVGACRYMCLAASRIGDAELFRDGIKRLEAAAKDDWARSNVAYLKGFNSRFQGNLPEAEDLFRESYALSPGNLQAAREIAAICLMRGNLDEAERFAREAHGHASSNPYYADILVSVLIKKKAWTRLAQYL